MQDVITIGKRLVPVEQIALVEPFDPASNPEFKPAKEFKARILMLNRDIVLTELTPQEFATAQSFRMLAEDDIAANPAIRFWVESFEPTESFKPTKPYQTRLKWRDQDGNEQSKLLLSKPEMVITAVLRSGAESAPKRREPARARVPRRRSRRSQAVPA
jgi:hypothetical protein